MKEPKIRFIAVVALIALSIILLVYYVSINKRHNESIQPQRSIFSWHEQYLSESDRTSFYSILDYLNIDSVYQCFSSEQLYSDETKEFVADLRGMNKDVYYLCGEPEWGISNGLSSIKNEIDRVAEYNNWTIEKGIIHGIVLDVEPYLTNDWDDDKDVVVKIFVDNMIAAYAYAKEKGFETVICIPYWLDNEYYEELELLISKGCDVAAVMNYNRRNEEESIRTEVDLSMEYQKSIVCIFEFQAEGKYGLTKNQTYAEAGVDAAINSFDKLSDVFRYEKFGCSFHSYDSILELLEGKTNVFK